MERGEKKEDLYLEKPNKHRECLMNYERRFMTLYRRQGKTIPEKKKCKKAKWLSGEALQIAVKRSDGKSKEEKERYSHLNAAFQRMAKRDKKATSVINAKNRGKQ